MIPTTESVTTLAKRWAAGDRRAGNELIASHDSWISTVARKTAVASEEVDDVAQVMREAFARTAMSVEAKRSDLETRAHLRSSMRRAVWGERRAHRRAVYGETRAQREAANKDRLPKDISLSEIEDTSLEPAALDTTEIGCGLSMIARAADLYSDDAVMLVAREAFGVDDEELANEQKISVRTLNRRISAAMVRIREAIGVAEVYVRARPSASENERRILEHLSRSGMSLSADIRAALNMTPHPFWVATTRLREIGALMTVGENRAKRYMLSDAAAFEQTCAA
jgi:DNA-directed RNA polymerase specialized sigma24 family protein